MRRRKENLAADDGEVSRCRAGRLDASDNNHNRRSNQFKPWLEIMRLSCPKFQRRQIITFPERIAALRRRAMLSRIRSNSSRVASSGEEFHLLRFVPWHRLLPWGCTLYPDGLCVIFDRDNLELTCLRPDKSPAVLPPRELISPGELRWFYCDATAPDLDPETLPLIQYVVDLCGLGEQIDYRQALSDNGRIPYKVWAQHWKQR